ncbi:MAG: phytoene/squalene synthase family protein [Bacteroidales bacterium]
MKELFDQVSLKCSQNITQHYSTSFSFSSRLLPPVQRDAIHAIYGFVRVADEIVDSFHGYPQDRLFDRFTEDLDLALQLGISTNPVLHAFQSTVARYRIPRELIDAFMASMRLDLNKKVYRTKEEYQKYIYGSADVVGLMCLKVFVNGRDDQYEALKAPAMRLGSAFQKVNFLRDLQNDLGVLDRSYFPQVDFRNLTPEALQDILRDIEEDFGEAFRGIRSLPKKSRLGVYVAYVYYMKLFSLLRSQHPDRILETRLRIGNPEKLWIMFKSVLRHTTGRMKSYA